jgi:hypothetical protein
MPSWAQPFRKIAIRKRPAPGTEKIVARRPLDCPGSNQWSDREGSFAGFAGGSMRYQVSSNELKFEVYGPSDSIWNEGDEVCVDFATDAASIFES